jgi:hypothetical protein
MFVYLIYAAALIALMLNVEHQANAWIRLFTQPTSRVSTVAAKLLCVLLLVVGGNLAFFIATLISGALVGITNPTFAAGSSPPVGEFARILVEACVASAFLVTIHLWLGLRGRNVLIPLSFGVLAALMNIFLRDETFTRHLFPWAHPGNVVRILGMPGATRAHTDGPPHRSWCTPSSDSASSPSAFSSTPPAVTSNSR